MFINPWVCIGGVILLIVLICILTYKPRKYPFVGLDLNRIEEYEMNKDLTSRDETIQSEVLIPNEETGTDGLTLPVEATLAYLQEGPIDLTPKISLPHFKTRPSKYNRPGSKKFMSAGELICKRTLERIFKVPFTNQRPKFLLNPETGRQLELDCYNEDLGIAVEYNGPQHYVYPNQESERGRQTFEEFKNQIRRDQLKADLCNANGITLITVPYNVPKEDIPRYITTFLDTTVRREIEIEETLDDLSDDL